MDAELLKHVEQARTGDHAAFVYVVEAFRESAHAQARRITCDAHLAEDAVQEAFLMAFVKLPDLRDMQAFPGWLTAIVRTTAVRGIRGRTPDLMEQAALEARTDDTQQDDGSKAAVSGELRQAIRAAVRGLGLRQRHVVEQYYLQGMSTAAIAARLNVPEGTIKRRLYEGREALRAKLTRHVDTFEPD